MEEFKTIKDIQKGDNVVGTENIVSVIHSFEEHIPKRMYEIEMENGELIKCSGNHLWYAETKEDRLEKDEYIELAKYFLSCDPNLDLLEEDLFLDLPKMIHLLSSDDKHKKYIYKVCNTVGHCGIEKVVNAIDLNIKVGESDVFLYSVNDVLKFIKGHQIALEQGEYFFFGKVYTTDTLFQGYDPKEVNIPTLDETVGFYHI